MYLKEVASKVKMLREAKQWTQDDLAKAINRHRITITRLEAGKPVIRTVLLAVASALGVPPSDLLGEDEGALATALLLGQELMVSGDRPEVARPEAQPARRTRDLERPYEAPGSARIFLNIPVYRRDGIGERSPYLTLRLPREVFLQPLSSDTNLEEVFAVRATNNALAPEIATGDLVFLDAGAKVGDGVALIARGAETFFVRGPLEDGVHPLGKAVAVFRNL